MGAVENTASLSSGTPSSAAQVLQVDTVMMGVSRRSVVYHLLRGHVVNGLTRHLPPSCHLLLHN